MSIEPRAFDAVTTAFDSRGVEGALAQLVAELRQSGSLHELFDARLMEARHRLGLPLLPGTSIDELPESVRDPLETAYLDACREVGGLFLERGAVREAWTYLRPLENKPAVAAALRKIVPAEDQIDPLIEVALHEGVDPDLGFELMLGRYGTCNAITLLDSIAGRLSRADQNRLAARLVRHLHQELSSSIAADIGRRGPEHGADAASTAAGAEDLGRLATVVARHDWLLADNNYHADPSHLHAVVRMARLVTDPGALELAADLTEYGRRLGQQHQYPGDAPFEELYPRSGQFFRALTGIEVEEAVDYFGQRARSTDAATQGAGPAEAYIVLLSRLGRHGEALAARAELLGPGVTTSGFAPSLMELSRLAGDYRAMMEQSRQQNNLLAYAAGLLATRRCERPTT